MRPTLVRSDGAPGRVIDQVPYDTQRAQLEHKADELEQSLRQRGRIEVERAADDMDATLLAAERESATGELERASRLLRQIKAALVRIRNGEYGVCLTCARRVSEKRLQAIPWALYCVECQESVDGLHARVDAFRARAA